MESTADQFRNSQHFVVRWVRGHTIFFRIFLMTVGIKIFYLNGIYNKNVRKKNTLLIIKKIAKMTNNLKVTIVKFDDCQVTIDDRQVREGKRWGVYLKSSRNATTQRLDDHQNSTIVR